MWRKPPADIFENKDPVSHVLIPLSLLTEQKKKKDLSSSLSPGSAISSLFIIHELVAVSVRLS